MKGKKGYKKRNIIERGERVRDRINREKAISRGNYRGDISSR